MAFLAKGKKADLVNVCEELGENVPPNSRVPDIKHIILESKNFNEEAVRIMLDRIIGERLEEAEAERQQLEHEAERQRLEREAEQQRLEREAEQQRREAEQQRLEREAEQRRLEREAEAEQRQIELQRLEIRRLEFQAAPAATTPPGRTEEVHHKIPLAQITPKFDEKKDEMSLFLVNFERHQKDPEKTWRSFAHELSCYFREWISTLEITTFEGLVNLLIAERIKAKAPEDIKDHFFGEWLELKQPEELANKFDEFESLKDSLRNNHHGRKQNESRLSHNDKSRFQDNRRKLSDNHARFRDNRGKYNDNHGRSTENHTRFYDKRQTKTEPGGRGSMPAQSKTSGQKNFRCYECDSPDHLRNACPELRRSQGNEISTHSDTYPVHIVNEVPEEAIEYPDVDLQKFTKQVKIGDFVVTALLDTGSVRNLIRFDVYKRMNPKTKLWRESTVLTGLGQGQVKTLGSFRHVAEIDGHVCRLDFQVVPSAALKFEAIIGSAFLAHAPCPFHEEKVKTESPDWIFNISKKEEQDELDLRHIQNAEITCRVEDMVSSYQPKKTESTDVSMKIILEDEIPVYQRARRLSFPERQETKKFFLLASVMYPGVIPPQKIFSKFQIKKASLISRR
ncbi:transposon Tf2-9 polyprotein [Trichonephila clavata]|uniref:Transposon Tf2-9 polyprotein n=1 Tax=Trichonephila clavata TaxID=2740835 RepID=A0A8X6K7T0_TRICU|nr:transposon Tf2-9 polyprotein [Trichonephila clavata]